MDKQKNQRSKQKLSLSDFNTLARQQAATQQAAVKAAAAAAAAVVPPTNFSVSNNGSTQQPQKKSGGGGGAKKKGGSGGGGGGGAKKAEKENGEQQQQTADGAVVAYKSPFSLDDELRNQVQLQEFYQIIKECIGDAHVDQIDDPIMMYILSVLMSQNSIMTRISDEHVLSLVADYLYETSDGVDGDGEEKHSKRYFRGMAQKMMDELRERNALVLSDNDEEVLQNAHGVKVLEEAVNLGKRFQDQLKKQQQMINKMTNSRSERHFGEGADERGVNLNEDIDWQEKLEKQAKDKKLKKQAKEDTLRMKEYEDYLKLRGLSETRGVFKLHNASSAVSGTRDILLENINISAGTRELLTGANLTLVIGRRYGLVGRNGIGKTTLLRNIVEREIPGIPAYLQILHIEQEVVGDDTTALQCVLKTDVERERLLAEEQRLLESTSEESGTRLAQIYERMDEIDAHSAESRAASILDGIGFTSEMQNRPTKHFSGGWRMRIAIARALFVEPDLLLLDEPTNHLDMHAVLWLENYLQTWKTTLVVVSHARSFLNSVATDIVHVNEKKLDYYRGNYDTFESTRREKLLQQSRAHEAHEKQRAHIQSFIDRFRYKAATAKMAQSRIKMLEKMDFVAAVVEDPTFSFSIPDPEPAAPPFIQAIDVTFGYTQDKILFSKLNFNLDMDSRIALVGNNGSGKTTFLNILCDELHPLEGAINRNRKIRVVKFSQHHMEQLNLQMTPLEHMHHKYPKEDDHVLRGQLGRYGLSGPLALQPMYTLSGGQKSRVVFSDVTFSRPHILLLDEPTNHLDIDTVDALINAINAFQGGVLVVSHDEHLISSIADEIWVAGNGRISPWNGNFQDYKQAILKELAF